MCTDVQAPRILFFYLPVFEGEAYSLARGTGRTSLVQNQRGRGGEEAEEARGVQGWSFMVILSVKEQSG